MSKETKENFFFCLKVGHEDHPKYEDNRHDEYTLQKMAINRMLRSYNLKVGDQKKDYFLKKVGPARFILIIDLNLKDCVDLKFKDNESGKVFKIKKVNLCVFKDASFAFFVKNRAVTIRREPIPVFVISCEDIGSDKPNVDIYDSAAGYLWTNNRASLDAHIPTEDQKELPGGFAEIVRELLYKQNQSFLAEFNNMLNEPLTPNERQKIVNFLS